MKCSSCGTELLPGSKFCEKCGTKVEEARMAPPPPPVVPAAGNGAEAAAASPMDTISKMPKDKLIKMGVVAIAVIIVIALVMGMMGGSGKAGGYNTKADALILTAYEDDSVVVSNQKGKTLELSIDRDDLNDYEESFDGSAMLITDYDYTLYLIKDLKEIEIADDVDDAYISDDGSYLAYVVYDDGESTLYYYDVAKEEETELESTEGYYETIALSPNGKTIAFTIYDYDDGGYISYVAKAGKEAEKFDKDTEVVAISDDAKYIYFYDTDKESFNVRVGDEDEKLASDAYDVSDIYFNADFTECIYNYGDSAYYSIKGSEKEKLVSDYFSYLITPTNSRLSQYNYSFVRYNVSSYANMFVMLGDDFAYINNKFEVEKIDDYAGVQLLEDNASVIYQHGDDIVKYTTKDFDDPAKEYETDGEDVYTWEATSDGKYVYFVNYDEELYCTKGEDDPEEIADDVESVIMIPGTNTIFFLADYGNDSGELYYSVNGKEKKKVENCDDVSRFAIYGDQLFCLADYDEDDGYNVYTVGANGKSKLYAEGVMGMAGSISFYY